MTQTMTEAETQEFRAAAEEAEKTLDGFVEPHFEMWFDGSVVGVGRKGQLIEYVEDVYVKGRGFEKVGVNHWQQIGVLGAVLHSVRLVPVTNRVMPHVE